MTVELDVSRHLNLCLCAQAIRRNGRPYEWKACRPGDDVLYVVLYMGATRTQIYLTEQQRKALDARRRRERKTLAAVVRDAIDAYLAKPEPADYQAVLDRAFGALPDLKVPPRSEWRKRARRLGY